MLYNRRLPRRSNRTRGRTTIGEISGRQHIRNRLARSKTRFLSNLHPNERRSQRISLAIRFQIGRSRIGRRRRRVYGNDGKRSKKKKKKIGGVISRSRATIAGPQFFFCRQLSSDVFENCCIIYFRYNSLSSHCSRRRYQWLSSFAF